MQKRYGGPQIVAKLGQPVYGHFGRKEFTWERVDATEQSIFFPAHMLVKA